MTCKDFRFSVFTLIFLVCSCKTKYDLEISNKICKKMAINNFQQIQYCNGKRLDLLTFPQEFSNFVQAGDSLYKLKNEKFITVVRYNNGIRNVRVMELENPD